MARTVFPEGSFHVSAHGGFAYTRSKPGQGQCSKGYPCTHPGLDCYPADLDAYAVAPERIRITHLATDMTTKPLSGYGPGAVMGVSAGPLASATHRRWHVLGHLRADDVGKLRVGQELAEGDPVGRVYAPASGGWRHVHWEVLTSLEALSHDGITRVTRGLVQSPRGWVRARRLLEAGAVAAAAIAAERLA